MENGKNDFLQVTVLVENTSDTNLKCEHGLSLWIEFQGKKILLDAGSSDLFIENASLLGIDVSTTDYAVLSHGHYDHSTGFGGFFEINSSAPVYARKGFDGKYFSNSGGKMHEISVPSKIISENRNRFILTGRTQKIEENVYLVPHNTPKLSETGLRAGLFKEEDGKIQPDDFAHEQSLVLRTSNGLVIFNSCSHAGLLAIVSEVAEEFPEEKIYAFFGGLHMKGKKDGKEICAFSEEQVDAQAEVIRKYGLSYVYTGHCTGLEGYRKLKDRLGEVIQPLTTGKMILM